MSYKQYALIYKNEDKETKNISETNYNFEVVSDGKNKPEVISLTHNQGTAISDELQMKSVTAVARSANLNQGSITILTENANEVCSERKVDIHTNNSTRVFSVGKPQDISKEELDSKLENAREKERENLSQVDKMLEKESFSENLNQFREEHKQGR